jgi:hypothetical protein
VVTSSGDRNEIVDKILENVNVEALKVWHRGSGKIGEDGLYNTQLDAYMRKIPGVLGTVAVDQVKDLKPGQHKQYSFIMNTQAFPKDGHWVSGIVTPPADKHTGTIEYNDPFGLPADKRFFTELRKILPSKGIFQSKHNLVKKQDDKSSNCGVFAMKFLVDRQKGMNFKQATGYETVDKSKEGEKSIIPMINGIKKFGYIRT